MNIVPVLHHEALRTNQTSESNNSDSAFVALVAECQNSANLLHTQTANKALSEQELFLFKMNPPKENGLVDFVIDATWIRGTGEHLIILPFLRTCNKCTFALDSTCMQFLGTIRVNILP